MAIEERDITAGQRSDLGRATAAVRGQFEAARLIARDEMGIDQGALSHVMLVELVKIIAINVQTVAIRNAAVT